MITPLIIGAVPMYLVYRHYELQNLQAISLQAENVAIGMLANTASTKEDLAKAINEALVAEANAEEARIRMQKLEPVATVGIPASGLAALLMFMNNRKH
jgi:hypothetical protein